LKFTGNKPTELLFLTFWMFLVFTLIWALFFLYKCMFLYKYRYVGSPQKMYEYLKKYKEYIKDTNDKKNKTEQNQQEEIKEEFYKLLFEHYSSSVDRNRENNIKKNAYLMKTIRSVFFAVIFLFLTAFFHQINNACESEQKQINNNKKEIAKMINTDRKNSFNKNGNTKPSGSKTPEKPTRPEPIDIGEANGKFSDVENKQSQKK